MRTEQIELQKTIDLLRLCIENYRDTDPNDGNTLLAIAQEVTALLYYLAEEKTRYHDNWQKYVFELTTTQKMNVNRAENSAHVEYPQLYQLRYIIRAGNEVVNIIRSQVSYLKSEINNLK
jgi:hypothetical protein